MKYREILAEMQKKAINCEKEESAIILLLMHASKMENALLYASMDEEINDDILNSFKELCHQYLELNIPVQYIMGHETFYGYQFKVNENVLIPRFETEELVENVLLNYDEFFNGQKVNLVDIGTGSGCLGITLALEEPNMNVTITDISQDALNVAFENANNLGAKVNILCGDMLKPLKNMKFDIIVSNPPYIPDDEDVESLVKDNEPHVALFGGEDGLKFYREILSGCKEILNPKAMICFEHAYNKKDEMITLVKTYFPTSSVEVLKDMQGKDRMTIVKIEG